MKKIILAIGILCPLATWAQNIDIKTGLWENTLSTEIAAMPAMPAMPAISEETLAKMPPAQRAQVEQMMKGRGSAGSPRATTTKSCITRETLSKPLYNSTDKTCNAKLVGATANMQNVHIVCAPGGTKTEGDMTIERIDPEHVKGTMVMTSTGEAGRSMDMKMTMNDKWISSDCGDVKPYEAK